MTCRSCGRALEADARFCPGCGAAAAPTCAACGTPLDEGARFCKSCGAPVEPAGGRSTTPPATAHGGPTRSERERKVATLLFADVAGFTRLGESYDPELVSALVANAFERLSVEVRRYEGTLEKFAGDALLAVFGVPTTHEDDPERAVRAALEMQSTMAELASHAASAQPQLCLRIGIESGAVLVDLARAGTARDLFVTGDAVNTAARLEAAAAPGTVVVGSSTYAASRGVIEYEELPALELKGKAAPVAAWRAVSVRARRGGQRAPLGLESPLVARQSELSLLKDTIHRAVVEDRPHLVTVIGSAGVGKSRLAWELEKYLDGLPDSYHWRKGRCLAYAGASFSAIADVVKADTGILDDDLPATARSKLSARLAHLPLGDAAASISDALEAVLAVGSTPERPRDELFEAWRRYATAIARLDPLVLVVEDIHWADEGLLDFLDFLARWGEGPMVLLCLSRHELLERRSTWGGGLPNAALIMLEPLAAEHVGQLTDGLVPGGIPSALRTRIVERSGGNPLFTEELVRMLVDQGVLRFVDARWEVARPVDDLDIPGTVHAVLAARLDNLPVPEKRAAQDAAVIGRIFWDALVAHLAGTTPAAIGEIIRRLRVKDLVVPRETSSLAGAAEYGFRHVLIRDVAYDSLPKRDRSLLHAEVARWAERELADRIDEFAELVAGHLAAALAYEEELAIEDEPTLRQLRQATYQAALRAAARASSVSQMSNAGRWLHLAVDQARRLGLPARERARLAEECAQAVWTGVEGAQRAAILAAAIDGLLALPHRDADDGQQVARLRSYLGSALCDQGDVNGARAELTAAIADREPGPPTPGRAQLLNTLGWTYWRAGPVAEAVPLLERAIAEAEAIGHARTLRWATHDLAVACAFLGRDDEAVALLEERHRLAREAGDRSLLYRCYINLPAVRAGRGDDPEEVAALALEGLGQARRAAASSAMAWIAGHLGDLMREMGRLEEALAFRDEAIIAALASGQAGITARELYSRSLIHRLRGERPQLTSTGPSISDAGPNRNRRRSARSRWSWPACAGWMTRARASITLSQPWRSRPCSTPRALTWAWRSRAWRCAWASRTWSPGASRRSMLIAAKAGRPCGWPSGPGQAHCWPTPAGQRPRPRQYSWRCRSWSPTYFCRDSSCGAS